jgi:hypothetical protein
MDAQKSLRHKDFLKNISSSGVTGMPHIYPEKMGRFLRRYFALYGGNAISVANATARHS